MFDPQNVLPVQNGVAVSLGREVTGAADQFVINIDLRPGGTNVEDQVGRVSLDNFAPHRLDDQIGLLSRSGSKNVDRVTDRRRVGWLRAIIGLRIRAIIGLKIQVGPKKEQGARGQEEVALSSRSHELARLGQIRQGENGQKRKNDSVARFHLKVLLSPIDEGLCKRFTSLIFLLGEAECF